MLLGHALDSIDYKQAGNFVNTVKRISDYVSANYKHGGDLRASIVNELRYVVPLPTPPAAIVDPNAQTNAEQTIQLIFKGEIDVYIKWRDILEDNIPKVYSIVLVQCTDLLQIKIKRQNQ